MNPGVEKRRDFRFPSQLHATTEVGGVEYPGTIKDVSFRGLYLQSTRVQRERQLVRVKIHGADAQAPLTINAMVIRQGQDGMGLELFANDRQALKAWEDIVSAAAAEFQAQDLPETVIKDGPAGEEGRRRYARFSAVLELRFRTSDELHTLYSENISKGGMFVQTSLPLDVGSEILLDVVHPRTDKIAHVMALVLRRQRTEAGPGVAVAFHNMDAVHRDAFWKFVQDGTAYRAYLDTKGHPITRQRV